MDFPPRHRYARVELFHLPLLSDVTSDRFEDESSQLSIRNVTVCECGRQFDPGAFLDEILVNSPFYLLAEMESTRQRSRSTSKIRAFVAYLAEKLVKRSMAARHSSLPFDR
jgi:hypothetical protein